MPDLKYAVLSLRNSSDLAAARAELNRAFARLRVTTLWKTLVKGAIVAEEITRNERDGTWHPHLNVVFQGAYIPAAHFRAVWLRVNDGKGTGAFIKKADSGTVKELLKYVTKADSVLGSPAVLDELLTAIKGRRLVRTYGVFYSMGFEDDGGPLRCPDCGSTKTTCLGFTQPWAVSLDSDGQLRVGRFFLDKLDRLGLSPPGSAPPKQQHVGFFVGADSPRAHPVGWRGDEYVSRGHKWGAADGSHV